MFFDITYSCCSSTFYYCPLFVSVLHTFWILKLDKFWSNDIKYWCYKVRRCCSQSYPLHLQMTTTTTTTVISKEVYPPSFRDLYLLWKLKHCLCHTLYYYILLTYVSLKSHVDETVLFVAKNLFSFKGEATNPKKNNPHTFCLYLASVVLF